MSKTIKNMQEIAELISIVNRNKVKRIDVIGSQGSKKSKQQQLYQAIATGLVKSDDEAIRLLYPNQPNGRTYYLKLKRNLYERLLNSIFFIDTSTPKFNDLQKAYYQCHKKFAEIKILLGRGARSVAIKLSEYTIRKTISFEFTDITIYLARILKSHYGQIEQNQRQYNYYKTILADHQEIYQYEILAEEYYTELILASKTQPTLLIEKANTFVEYLEPYKNKIQSFRFIQFFYHITLIKHNAENNQEKVLEVCQEIINKFKHAKKYNPSNLIALYLNESLPIAINQKNYSTGEKIAKQSLKILAPNSKNWFVTNQLLTTLYFHAKEYQKAYMVFITTTSTKEFNGLNEIFKEKWKIIEGFIHYLISVRKIKPDGTLLRPFRLSRFVNDVPKYSKDKRGLNITIIIIQILFLLKERKHGVIIDKMDSLQAYCNRYLRKDETFRSNCFIKMLLELPNSNFNKIAAIRKTEPLLRKLKSVPLEIAEQRSEIEFIPYEDLWEMVLESLDNKIHKPTK